MTEQGCIRFAVTASAAWIGLHVLVTVLVLLSGCVEPVPNLEQCASTQRCLEAMKTCSDAIDQTNETIRLLQARKSAAPCECPTP